MQGTDRISQLDRAIRGLRALVLSGSLRDEARISEVAVAERLGTSRTPLRQAMDRLISEGLLERIPTGGCRVAKFTEDDIADAIELRGVLEGTAARLAAERGADPQLFAEATQTLDRIDTALGQTEVNDFNAYVTENKRFHILLSRLARSPLVEREVARISDLPLASPSAFLGGQELVPDFRASLIHAQRQHRAILEAIANREGTRAEGLAREHARLARTNFEYVTRKQPTLAAKVPGLALVATG
jgi:GntR family transcriptional regulator of vanillate catabolism